MSRFLYLALVSFFITTASWTDKVITGDQRTEMYFPLLE